MPNPSRSNSRASGGESNNIDTFIEQSKRPLSKFQTLESDTRISVFEGLSLNDYANARSYVCKARHSQPRQLCSGMIKVARMIVDKGYLKLKDAFIMTSPGATYTSLHARRKLLQMPLVSIGVGDQKKGQLLHIFGRETM